jgi:hypothetical protein
MGDYAPGRKVAFRTSGPWFIYRQPSDVLTDEEASEGGETSGHGRGRSSKCEVIPTEGSPQGDSALKTAICEGKLGDTGDTVS